MNVLLRYWVQNGNKLTLLLILLIIAWGVYWVRTLPERDARINALKIAGGLEYEIQVELLLGNVHAVIDPENQKSVIVSGTVTNGQDLARLKKLADDWTVESVPMKVSVTLVGAGPP